MGKRPEEGPQDRLATVSFKGKIPRSKGCGKVLGLLKAVRPISTGPLVDAEVLGN